MADRYRLAMPFFVAPDIRPRGVRLPLSGIGFQT